MDFPTISPLGDRAIIINFAPEISENLLERILVIKEQIENSYIEEKVEVVNTYHSVSVFYVSGIEDFYGEKIRLKKLLETSKIGKKYNTRLFHVPVCYHPDFGLDLELLSEERRLPVEEIISLHSAPEYTVFFMGFLPGFLYLGGLDKRLRFPRKNHPRMKVEKGAVGIGEDQTGIYPKTSPGGWQIIGNSPIPLFNKDEEPPAQIHAGDRIKFYAVSREKHAEILEQVKNGTFQLNSESYEG